LAGFFRSLLSRQAVIGLKLVKCVLARVLGVIHSLLVYHKPYMRETTQKIFQKCQHGFLRGKSCVTNLLEAIDYIGRILDNGDYGGQVDTIYLDMSKAFDRINHTKLITKLRNYGFGGNLLKYGFSHTYRIVVSV
jgi:hypothetical protein